MRVVLAVMLLLVCGACGGDDHGGDGQRLALYHLEIAIGGPGAKGELRCGPPRPVCPGVITQPPPGEVHYELLGAPELEEDAIDRAGVRADGSTVSIPFTPDGTAAFARLTREVAHYGARDQGWHHVAVVVGDELVAFPEIDFDKYPDGIAHAPAVQLPASSEEDARDLVERLRGG
jgi:hypothetical protein